MQLVIMAARNRTKSFNLLLAGQVPAGDKGWFRNYSKVRRRFGAASRPDMTARMFLPQPSLEDIPKRYFAMGPDSTVQKTAQDEPSEISNGTICNAVERDRDNGPGKELSGTRISI
jgi:hypothetical protein